MCQLDPEEQAREKIDKMLEDNGWRVVSRKVFVPNEALAVKKGLQDFCDKGFSSDDEILKYCNENHIPC